MVKSELQEIRLPALQEKLAGGATVAVIVSKTQCTQCKMLAPCYPDMVARLDNRTDADKLLDGALEGAVLLKADDADTAAWARGMGLGSVPSVLLFVKGEKSVVWTFDDIRKSCGFDGGRLAEKMLLAVSG